MSKNQLVKKPTKEQEPRQEGQEKRPEAAPAPSVENLIKVSQETPPYIAYILEMFGREEHVDEISGLNTLKEMVADELYDECEKNPESETAKGLSKFKAEVSAVLKEMEKNNKIEEKHEASFFEAHKIFKKALIDDNNDNATEGKEISLSDDAVSLRWHVDDEMPAGEFSLVQSLGLKEQAGGYIDVLSPHPLKTEQVKEIFNKLKPVVKKSFLDGLRDKLAENENLAEKLKDPNYRKKLKVTDEEAEDMKQDALDQQEEIKKELQALD